MTLLSRLLSRTLKDHLINFKTKGMLEDHLVALEVALLERFFRWKDNKKNAGSASGLGSMKVEMKSLKCLSPWEDWEGGSDIESNFHEKKLALIDKQGNFVAAGFSRVPTPPLFGPLLALSLAYEMAKSQRDSDQKQ